MMDLLRYTDDTCVFCLCSRLHAVLSQRPAFIVAILYELYTQTTSVSNKKKNNN